MDNQMNRGSKKHGQLKEAGMPTTNHLLVIGINLYENGLPRLNNAVKDAKAFEEIMKAKYGFKEEHIISLYDEDATRDNILDAFDQLHNLTPDDNLIIYFSGHGEMVQATQRGYWVPFNARAHRRGDYLINTEIQDFIATCKARHILGIVDACYSGSLLRDTNDNPSLARYYTKPSRRLMTSGLIEPVPDGLPDHHSPFAAALLTALKYNKEPYLRTSALWLQMEEGVIANTSATPVYEYMHNAGHQGGEFYFIQESSDEIPPEEPSTENLPKESSLPYQERVVPSTAVSTGEQSLDEIKHNLKLQATDDLDKFFKSINKVVRGNSRTNNDFILQQGRYNQVKRDKTIGVISNEDYYRTINQIRYALTSLIDDIEQDDL